MDGLSGRLSADLSVAGTDADFQRIPFPRLYRSYTFQVVLKVFCFELLY